MITPMKILEMFGKLRHRFTRCPKCKKILILRGLDWLDNIYYNFRKESSYNVSFYCHNCSLKAKGSIEEVIK